MKILTLKNILAAFIAVFFALPASPVSVSAEESIPIATQATVLTPADDTSTDAGSEASSGSEDESRVS